ncbi:hypothetical protein LCGC14_0625900 [marine sediment metagenome]|uniref:Uncharacterized protein n=1 Tax=marine sediment metagenome TaxID=412755 RepID=A0A0F9TPU7_9ZZZZ
MPEPILDTPQTGYIWKDEIPSCVRVMDTKIRCTKPLDCTVETCFFRQPKVPIIKKRKRINR